MMLTQQQIDDMLNASREADEGPTALARRIEAAAMYAERERCAKLCDAYESGGQDWAAIAAGELAREIRGA